MKIKRSSINLEDWARQGVLLLNSALTFDKNSPKLHRSNKFGWNEFIENLIYFINKNTNNVIFVLWGNDAKSKEKLIDKNKHHVIKSSHPSNMGGSYKKGFKGSKPFSKINEMIDEKIKW